MKEIEVFFDQYSAASMHADAGTIASFYAPDFMVATKNEVASFKNDDTFIKWLRQVFDFNRQAGLLQMKVSSIQTSFIGEYHIRASVKWEARFSKRPDQAVNFDIHYILHAPGDGIRIVFYISEEDQEQLMKEKGLL